MILIVLFDGEQADLIESFSVESRDAALAACRGWADRPGRSGFFMGDRSAGGCTGGYWHDGQAPQYTNTAGPARTARETVPVCSFCVSTQNLKCVAGGFYVCPACEVREADYLSGVLK